MDNYQFIDGAFVQLKNECSGKPIIYQVVSSYNDGEMCICSQVGGNTTVHYQAKDLQLIDEKIRPLLAGCSVADLKCMLEYASDMMDMNREQRNTKAELAWASVFTKIHGEFEQRLCNLFPEIKGF